MNKETVHTDNSNNRIYGLLAEFDTTDAIIDSAEKVRDAGYKKWDVHTPFPVHGLDEAMGIKPTILPWLVLGGGITGAAAGLLLQWWTNAVDYPHIISGKPFFSLPANIPIIFEVTVLVSAITTVLGLFGLNQLPKWYHPLFTSHRFRRVTTDRFFIVIEAADPIFDLEKTRTFLSSLTPAAVDAVED